MDYFAGEIEGQGSTLGIFAGCSSDFTGHAGGVFDSCTQPLIDRLVSGASARMMASAEPQQQGQGEVLQVGGQELFEKVVLTPRTKALGFVLSDVFFDVDVWNTHRVGFVTATGYTQAGTGNADVSSPQPFPLDFAPQQSHKFTVKVPAEGDATIEGTVTWVIVGELGTDLLITGQRIVIFAPAIDWSDAPKERTQYLTDILPGYSGKEQRVALRTTPRTLLKYHVLSEQRRDSAALEAMLWGWQHRIYGVPFWPDAQQIAQAVAAGDSVIYADTSYRKFTAGGLAMLWRDLFTCEAVTVQSVTPDSITITSPLNGSWPADGHSYLVPVLQGRLSGEHELNRLTNAALELDAVFQCEVI